MTDPITAGDDRLADAWMAADPETVVSLFCKDAVMMPPNDTTLFGRAEIREWYQEYFENFKITGFAVTEREVLPFDSWAILRSAYSIAITPLKEGDRIRDDGRWFAVWKHDEDGVWRMSQAMFNSTRPVGSGTSRFMSRMAQRRNQE